MSKELNEFISVGLTRYKEAHNIYKRFQSEIKELLLDIIDNRENYGKLSIKEDSAMLRLWDGGLMITARISTSINNENYFLGIGLDWSSNKRKLPLPVAWIEDNNERYVNLNNTYSWSNTLYNKNNQLAYNEDYKSEDLELIFKNLLDEIIEYMNTEL